jgi:cell fate regulator YaaT (PSP1 superfamily)
LTEVISVRFLGRSKIYFFAPRGLTVTKGDNVIVETAKGTEYAECVYGNHAVDERAIVPPLRPVVRAATPEDNRRAAEYQRKNDEAFVRCQEKIAEYGLEMKLVRVEYNFDGSKILFFFTSEGRVDFRELVKELASMFKTRIELRQIGVRDEAKMIGGLGVCGKPFCCSQFLSSFHPVSIKMAKTQGLSLNPAKISGTCGRLMCCLKYEEAAYEDIVKRAPKSDAFVETPAGKGSVVNVNLLRGSAKVRLEEGMDTTLKTFPFEELEVLGGKARRAEYITARNEGRLEEAGFKASKPVPQIKSDFSSVSPAPPYGGREQRGRPPQRSPQRPPQQSKPAQDADAPAAPGESGSAAPAKKSGGRNKNRNWRGKKPGGKGGAQPQQKQD